MRVLHFIPSVDRASGGVGAYMQLLSKELGRLVELHVVTCKSADELPIENATLHYVDPQLTHIFKAKKQFRALLDTIKPDIVHVNACWEPLCALTVFWAKSRGYKVVLTPHGMLEPWIIRRHYLTKKLPALLLYQRKAVKLANCIHSTAESEKENLLKLRLNNNIFIVPNAVDVEAIRIKQTWKRTGNILFLSRIHPKKGINFLIEAFSQINENWYLIIAGDGEQSYINDLKSLAKQRGVSERVSFIGAVYGDEKWNLFRNADVFVLPTYSENFGIVVTEALACGTPVITTKGTPWQELNTRHCGWWTEIGTEATLKALQAFSSCSEQELEAMGRNGRSLVEEKYSIKSEAVGMVNNYKKIIESNK